MHRNITSGSPNLRWENCDNYPVSGSLILNSSPHSPKNTNNLLKMKLSDLGFRQGPFQRH
jgi:hypothetical protein